MVHGAPVPLRVVSRFAIVSRDCRRHRPTPRGITWRKAVRLFREARGRGSRHLPCTGVCYYGHGVPVAMCDPDVVARTGCAMLWRRRISHVGVAGPRWRKPCGARTQLLFSSQITEERDDEGNLRRKRTCCIRSAESGEALLQSQRDRPVPVLRPWPMPTLPNPSELAKVVRLSCVP